MNRRKALQAAGFCLLVLSGGPASAAGFGDIFKKAQDAAGGFVGSGGLSNTEIIDGLKEALSIGTGNAVGEVARTDGYNGNSDIRIPLPGQLDKYDQYLRMAGLGDQLDSFKLSMNRAAERAAPKAKGIFTDAVTRMTFDDAKGILQGPDDAATRYFQDKTTEPLTEAFKPIVHQAMSEVGVTRRYQDLSSQVTRIPMVDLSGLDLDGFVTGKALDGLFHMLAIEEMKIRTDPAARVTSLLQKVFK